ncbi:MAG: hypothetical protein Unbinned3325contig1000_13 [Prokaryotic dsDNA virus sp.]|nr:MAG: hypothetical protein Unbinned3325contig1000_13 [Prokaryotic dsDNA virus sp.]|tara:strand:- start:3968 stop:4351 length:384 start_codon:yes stop_codon:yes gene_type:complete
MNINNISVRLLNITYCDNDSLPRTIEELFWELDCDMNGNNGEEYLWEDAKANGFDCNLSYITKLYEDKMDDDWWEWDDHSQIDDCIQHFAEFYHREGYNYYKLGDAYFDTNDNGKTWKIAIPYITYY